MTTSPTIGDYLPKSGKTTLHEYFCRVMREKGITQYTMTKDLHVAKSSISRLWLGDGRMSTLLAVKLEKYLGIPAMVWMYLQMQDDIRATKAKHANEVAKISSYKNNYQDDEHE